MKQRGATSSWLSPVKVLLLLWLLGLLGLGAAYRTYLYPRQQLLQNLRRDTHRMSDRLMQLQQAQSPQYQQQLVQALSEEQTRCERLLFSDLELNRLDFRLRELARDHAVDAFESSNIFERTDKHIEQLKRVDQRQIVTQCEAEFPQFLRFLNALERNEPALFVAQLGLSCPFEPDRKPTGQIELFALHEKDATVAQGNPTAKH